MTVEVAYRVNTQQAIHKDLLPLGQNEQRNEKILILVCAYNEEDSLPNLLEVLEGKDVLIVNDGSTDRTHTIATHYGATVLSHEERLGKAASLADGISYALQNSYDIVIEIGADAIPKPEAIPLLLQALERPTVGGASCKQVPVGIPNVAYHLDELIWAILAEGKKLQMDATGSSHLGAVMFAFKPDLVDSVEGSINDDERVGLSIKIRGFLTPFVEDSVVYFDSSSCLGHILQRRRRMYFGHLKYKESTAPSMQPSTAVLAFTNALRKKPHRMMWALPALFLDACSRMLAWHDTRRPEVSRNYTRWVTTYAKNNPMVIRNRSRS